MIIADVVPGSMEMLLSMDIMGHMGFLVDCKAKDVKRWKGKELTKVSSPGCNQAGHIMVNLFDSGQRSGLVAHIEGPGVWNLQGWLRVAEDLITRDSGPIQLGLIHCRIQDKWIKCLPRGWDSLWEKLVGNHKQFWAYEPSGVVLFPGSEERIFHSPKADLETPSRIAGIFMDGTMEWLEAEKGDLHGLPGIETKGTLASHGLPRMFAVFFNIPGCLSPTKSEVKRIEKFAFTLVDEEVGKCLVFRTKEGSPSWLSGQVGTQLDVWDTILDYMDKNIRLSGFHKNENFSMDIGLCLHTIHVKMDEISALPKLGWQKRYVSAKGKYHSWEWMTWAGVADIKELGISDEASILRARPKYVTGKSVQQIFSCNQCKARSPFQNLVEAGILDEEPLCQDCEPYVRDGQPCWCDCAGVPCIENKGDQWVSSGSAFLGDVGADPIRFATTRHCRNRLLQAYAGVKEKERKRFIPDNKGMHKLHCQFGHVPDDKLRKLLCQAGVPSKQAGKLVKGVKGACRSCACHDHPDHRPIVSGTVCEGFNTCVEMDLWFAECNKPILSIYDKGQIPGLPTSARHYQNTAYQIHYPECEGDPSYLYPYLSVHQQNS